MQKVHTICVGHSAPWQALMTAGCIVHLLDRIGIEDDGLIHRCPAHPRSDDIGEPLRSSGKTIRYHLITNRRDDCEISITAVAEVTRQVCLLKMFIDIADNDPIRVTAAMLPRVVVELQALENDAISHDLQV